MARLRIAEHALLMEKTDRVTPPAPIEVPPAVAAPYTDQDAPEPSGWNRRNWFITAWLERLEREKL